MEETAMYRSEWELTSYVRYRLADLADEHPARGQIDHAIVGLAMLSLLTQLRERLGIGLIRIGQALAGSDAVRGLHAPPARPAIGRSGS
jgi:hypothetical protein